MRGVLSRQVDMLCIVCAMLGWLAACGFEAPPPQRTPPPPMPLPPISTLTATLSVPASAIAAALNDKTQTDIAHLRNQPVDCAIAKCLLNLDATRSGPITVSAANTALSITLPLSVRAQVPVKGPFFKTTANGTAQGTAEATTILSLGANWRIVSNTTGKIRLSQGELELGPLKMNVAELWNRNADELSRPLFRALDRTIAADLKVKPEAERLWRGAVRPIRVAKSPQAWLVLAPERVRLAQPLIENDAVTIALGVDVRAHVVVLDHSPEPAVTPPLPPLAPLNAQPDRFAFVVPVLLPYDQAAALAMRRLAEKPIRVAGMPVHIQSLSILPSGRDVVVAIRFCVKQGWDTFGWFDSCGEGYLRGVPQFDAATRTIRIANVHYDVATEGLLASSMRALAGPELARLLESKLVFEAGRDIAKLDSDILTALARPEGRGVRVRGNAMSFGPPSLSWTTEGFLATFPAEGTVLVDLNLPH
jgi:hypothetical protein